MKPTKESQGESGGKPSTPPGQNKPPKTDEEVEDILNQTIPSEAEHLTLVHDIFLRLLPTIYTKEILAQDPTGGTKTRVQQLRRHAEQIAEVVSTSRPEAKSNYGLLRSRQARKIKFFL